MRVKLIVERKTLLSFDDCLALTPKEYLEKYCRVNHRRYTLYKRIFDKYKDGDGEIPMKVRKSETTV